MSELSRLFKRILPVLGPAFVCVLLPSLLVLSTIDRHPKFSPIDEAAHFDYVERVYSHGVPTFGDHLLKSTLRETVCRGTRIDGLVLPECLNKASRYAYEQFPGGAYQYEAQQPPVYYLLTSPVAHLISKFSTVGPVGAARLVGISWLVGGLLLLWAASRLLRVPRIPMLATIAVIAASPNVTYYSSIVSNDSAGIFFGALAAYFGARSFTRGERYLGVGIVLGVAAALVKTSCALPVGVVGLILLAYSIWKGNQTGESRRDMRSTGLGMISGAVAGTLLWVMYYRTVATIEPKKLPTFDVLRTGPVNIGNILGQAKSFLAPLTDAYNPFSAWNGEVYGLLTTLTMLTIVAGLIAGAYSRERSWWAVSGTIVVVSLYLGGVVIGIGIWRAYDINPGVSARYALPMVPLVALIVPAGIQRHVGRIIYSLGCIGTAFLSIWMITHVSLA